jgi:putative resolvase
MQSHEYVSAKHIVERYDVTKPTLRRWAEVDKKIRFKRSGELQGRRLYHAGDVAKLFGDNLVEEAQARRSVVLYARVSSAKQSADLERQCQRLREHDANAELIRDIGSGLNYRRRGFKTLLDRISEGTIATLVVTHKDRLVRFGLDLVEWLCRKYGTAILVLDQAHSTDQDELRDDLLAVTTFFVAQQNGRRAAANRKRRKTHQEETKDREDASQLDAQDSSGANLPAETIAQEMDGDESLDLQSSGGVGIETEEVATSTVCHQ